MRSTIVSRGIALTSTAVLAWGSAAEAQLPPPIRGSAPIPPANGGQWAGSYALAQITAEHPTTGDHLLEIAHAVVLPDPDGAVLFWCRVQAGVKDPAAIGHPGTFGPTHTWLWDPNSPQNVLKIDVPNNLSGVNDGTQDMFCGGAQFEDTGDVLEFGGTDLTQQVLPVATGHTAAFRFDAGTRTWTAAGAMANPRWYPNAFPSPLSSFLLVLGHDALPHTTAIQQQQDRLPFGSSTWTASVPNREHIGANPCDPFAAAVEITAYPRGHLSARLPQKLVVLELGNAGEERVELLDFTTQCTLQPLGGAPDDRWKSYVPDYPPFGVGTPPAAHVEGATAHYMQWNANSGQYDEVIYAAGGTKRIGLGSLSFAQDAVDKLVNPDFGTQPAWNKNAAGALDDPPNLHYARENLNLVIGADGALIALGGNDLQNGVDGASINIPETYMPPELGGTTPYWTVLDSHDHERRYHSVAGLLPDGRIFHAGGDEPEVSHHSIEIFSPPYLFKGTRPVVTNVSMGVWDLGSAPSQNSLDVQFRTGVQVQHVALIKTGSVTHGFDSSQRHIKLDHSSLLIGPDKYQLTMTEPVHHLAAPKGDYWLFVVSTEGVPSLATTIHIQ